MYRNNILLAAALQQWDRYSVHALAARDVAVALSGQSGHLHVLSVYEYLSGRIPASGLPAEMAARIREQRNLSIGMRQGVHEISGAAPPR